VDFYFPDSQDQIDPRYRFDVEEHPPHHVRQRDDRYAHEVHYKVPYTGLLVSKAMADGSAGAGRYTPAQRHRLYRLGVHKFFRLSKGMKALGDCGAFSYAASSEPPITVDEVIDFYEGCGFDLGISVDHVILDYRADAEERGEIEPRWIERQEMTLRYAGEFLERHAERRCRFTPLGAAQGWSPRSYAYCVDQLQRLGYKRIALGGMVPLKTEQILDCLQAIRHVRNQDTEFHLLGITRTQHVVNFEGLGVTSFDSTSPFRQAFKDDKDNYWTEEQKYVALRVPPSEGNTKLQSRIRAGQLDQREVRRLEVSCLTALRAYDRGVGDLTTAVTALGDYERLHSPGKDHTEAYRQMLDDSPWQDCPCAVCQTDGIEVAIFRGTERNKRRGFHNLWVFNQTLQGYIAGGKSASALAGEVINEFA
jgi:hypothetical protein